MLKYISSNIFILFLSITQLAAQASSGSPYSDQAYDPIKNPSWYETPFLWVGLVIVLLFLFFWIRKRKK